jgi:hypothetical protein
MSRRSKARILVIPDLQIPFHHPDSLRFLLRLKKEYKTTDVVCVGDEWDNCALSEYPKDPDGMNPGAELLRARQESQAFYQAFPEVKLCDSNHKSRLWRRAFSAGLPLAAIRDVNDFTGAPRGWRWATRWEVGGTVFEHGDRAAGADAALKLVDANMASTVIGHHHSTARITYVNKAGLLLFGMNVGCLVDSTTYAFNYTKHHQTRPVLSAGVIVDGVPRLEPMVLNKAGRYR